MSVKSSIEACDGWCFLTDCFCFVYRNYADLSKLMWSCFIVQLLHVLLAFWVLFFLKPYLFISDFTHSCTFPLFYCFEGILIFDIIHIAPRYLALSDPDFNLFWLFPIPPPAVFCDQELLEHHRLRCGRTLPARKRFLHDRSSHRQSLSEGESPLTLTTAHQLQLFVMMMIKELELFLWLHPVNT